MKQEHDTRPMLPIAAVERETGLGKDTLRAWEKRYGFPCPLRDAHGERCYPAEQVERLRVLKRLLDAGQRPGKLVGASAEELAAHLCQLEQSTASALPRGADKDCCAPLMDLLRLHRSEELRRALHSALMKRGLPGFVIEVVAPMNHAVGDAWMRGHLDVVEEHLYTEHIQNLLRSAIAAMDLGIQGPRVLLTTLSEEPHTLGLLMVEALMVAEGAQCISLGAQLPIADIAQAALDGFDIVALSFSAAYPPRQASEGLANLRRSLPAHVSLWAGGQGLGPKPRAIEGVTLIQGIKEVVPALEAWRRQHAT